MEYVPAPWPWDLVNDGGGGGGGRPSCKDARSTEDVASDKLWEEWELKRRGFEVPIKQK